MKATELMIGDWAQNPLGCKGIVVSIMELNEVGDGFGGYYLIKLNYSKSGDSYAVLEAKDILPIPLTSEILEKNGFEKTELRIGSTIYTFSDKDEFYAIAIDEYTDSVWRIEYTNQELNFPLVRNLVCHVHEFQHALKLCGIEKEISI